MKTRAIAVALALLIVGVGIAQAQTNVTVDPAEINLGFMNVFNLPSDGGAFQFASPWGFADLTAVYAGDILTLGPNTIGDPDPYWYIGGGGPGAPGNKIMEANGYAEVTDGLAGQLLTFSGDVLSNTLTSAHTVRAFIKDFAPDFSSFNESSIVLSGTGPFSISLACDAGAGRHVQWGFQMVGVNVWVTDVAPYGTLVVAPNSAVSEETSSFGAVKALFR